MLLSPSRVFARRSHAFSTLYVDVTFSIAFTASGQVFTGGGGGVAGVGDGAAVVVGAGVVVAASSQGHHNQPLQSAVSRTCSKKGKLRPPKWRVSPYQRECVHMQELGHALHKWDQVFVHFRGPVKLQTHKSKGWAAAQGAGKHHTAIEHAARQGLLSRVGQGAHRGSLWASRWW